MEAFKVIAQGNGCLSAIIHFLTIKHQIMKNDPTLHGAAERALERIKADYADLLHAGPFCLERRFAPEHFHFGEFCKDFRPHAESEFIKKEAEAFGRRYGAWLENSKHYINVAWYLYPSANPAQALTITKNLSLGFYLNDVMGRDVFPSLPVDAQQAARQMIENMALLDEQLQLQPEAHPLEVANMEILREFKSHSPRSWFQKFLRIYCHHLNITHRNRNAASLGYIPDTYEYIENRCHYAAVHHLVMWIEYSDSTFLDWDKLMRTNFYQQLQRLHWVVAAFPALANDLFSFENEVIDNDCDSNLVSVIVLNNPHMSLREAIDEAAAIVRNIVREIMDLLPKIEGEAHQLRNSYPDLASMLTIHLNGITRFVQASWLWQAYSKRYKRPESIWQETRLVREPMTNSEAAS